MQDQVGQGREIIRQLFQPQLAGNILRRKAEHRGVFEVPHEVHLPFDVAVVLCEPLLELTIHGGEIRLGVQVARVQQLI